MCNEIEQTRFIVEYGARLAGVAQRSVERITSYSHLEWISAVEDEVCLFEYVIQKWTDEFEGSEWEKKNFQAFTVNAKEAFHDSVFQALEEATMIRFAQESEFSAQLRQAREEMARRRAMGIEDEPMTHDDTPAPEIPKSVILYHTADDVAAHILARDSGFPDWLIKRCSEISEEVLVSLSNKHDTATTLKLLEKQINKLRVKLWDQVRPFRQHAENEAATVWVRTTTANAVNYCTVILTGASKNVLDVEQSKLYESGIRSIQQHYVDTIFNMNNTANTQAITTEAANSASFEKETTMSTNTTNACAEETHTSAQEESFQTNQESISGNADTAINIEGEIVNETTASEEKIGFFRQATNHVKNKAMAFWSGVSKVSAVKFLTAYLFGIAYFAVLFVIAKFLTPVFTIIGLGLACAFIAEILFKLFSKAVDYIKDRFAKSANEGAEPVAA